MRDTKYIFPISYMILEKYNFDRKSIVLDFRWFIDWSIITIYWTTMYKFLCFFFLVAS